MELIKIKATFIGKNGSMGFISGLEYEHIVITHLGSRIALFITNDCTSGTDLKYRIPYQSLSAFLRNWTNIHTVTEFQLKNMSESQHANLIGFMDYKIPEDL